jgi:hypothetical protein
MQDVPKPFVSGDQAFFGTVISAVWQTDRSIHHEFQDLEQLFCGLYVPLVARMMERGQDLVGQALFHIPARTAGFHVI